MTTLLNQTLPLRTLGGMARRNGATKETNKMSSLFDWSPRPRPQSPRSPRLSSPTASPLPVALLQEYKQVKQEQGEEEQQQQGKEQGEVQRVDNFSDINDGEVVDGVVGSESIAIGTSVGVAVGASINNDSRDQEQHESHRQELEVQQTKEKRENPCFIKDGGPKGTFRELRVWQVNVIVFWFRFSH
jgi:hypothetical protein